MSINFNQSILVNKEYWIKQGFPGMPGTSNIGVDEELLKVDIQPELLDKVIAIAQERLRIEQHPLITAVIGEEDFLPLSIFETGVKQSLAVCRIARYFSLETFQQFIKDIISEIEKRKITSNFESIAKIKEIFSFADGVAESIGGLNDCKSESSPEKKLKISIDNLKALKKITENQLAKINPVPIGSGFLVGVTHLITNQHVIQDAKTASECVAQFNYVDDTPGNTVSSIDYQLAPEKLFISERNLDYSLVQLESGTFTRQAGSKFGWIQLVEEENNICPGLAWIEIDNLDKQQNIQDLYKKFNTELATEKESNLSLKSYEFVDGNEGIVKIQDKLFILVKNTEKDEKLISEKFIEFFTEKIRSIFKDYYLRILRGDSVIIVQHPKGKKKQIALNDGVIDYGLYNNFLRYKTDSDYGSSGSPVFNNQWHLVALHHAAIFQQEDDITNQRTVIAEQGVRICRIIEDLKKKSVSYPKLASFIEDFVVTSEQLNYPPLPSALEFNGESSYVDLGSHDLDINKGITFEAWIKRNSISGDATIVSQVSQSSVFSLSWEKGKIWVNVKSQSKKHFTRKAVLNDNNWHHVALVLHQQYVHVYLDGNLEDIEGSQDYQEIEESKNNLLLGWGKFGYFNGFMAEVRIWRIKREECEIKANMYRRLAKDEYKQLTGYWRFEEAEGYKVENLAKDNTYTATEQSNCNGFKDFGLEWNGKNDYIDCGKDEKLNFENGITIEAWVKSSTENQREIIVNRGGSWNEKGYCLWHFDGKIRVELKNENEKITVDTVDHFLKDNNWHHVAFTWSGKSDLKKIKIYIDGEKQTTHTEEGKFKPDPIFQGPIGEPQENLNLNIGRAQGYGYYFNGAIAEVRLWNVARTEDEIKENKDKRLENNDKQLKVNMPELVRYWRLDEEEGNTAKNLAPDGGDGIVCGGKWLKPYCLLTNNQGAFGVAYRTNRLKASQYPGLPLPFGLKFNEEGDRVDCGNENLSVSEAITVEAWFKHKYGNCVIVSRVDADHNGYSLSWNSRRIRVTLQSQDSSEEKFVVVYTKENAPQDGVWHHIAFTWERKLKEVSLYIDGRIQDCVVNGSSETIVFAGQTRSIGLFTGSLDNLTANLLIGYKEEKETYYNVAIADVRLWNRVRTQDEIKANMSRRLRLTGKENDLNGLVGYWRLDDGGEGNSEVQNLVPNSQPGKITGATWFPEPPKLIEKKNTTNQENNSIL